MDLSDGTVPERRTGMDLQGYYPADVRKGIFKGVDLNVLAKRFWALDAMRADGRSLPRIKWRSRAQASVGGTAWTYRITMRLGPSSIEDAAEVLLHELVHCSCPVDEHHGELFRRRLIACAREAFGLDLDTGVLLAAPADGGTLRAYTIDRRIRSTMELANVGERLRAGAPAPTPPPEVAPEVIEAAKVKARKIAASVLVAQREEHARKMLSAWERKLAAARRLRAKWARKVRYYERAAAKRAGG